VPERRCPSAKSVMLRARCPGPSRAIARHVRANGSAMAVLTVLGVVACAHGPRRDLEPIPGQLGCYLVRVDRGQADRDLPPWFRAHIPDQLALTAERESGDETFEPGWRLATLGGESARARDVRALAVCA